MIYSEDQKPGWGKLVISATVFAVGYDHEFIIAKQHPYLAKEIENRLNDPHLRNASEHFEITDLKDTIYLTDSDSLYQANGHWYHTDHTSVSDSLKPYKGITYFHIIEINKPKDHSQYTLHTFDNEGEFMEKRLKLGVPENLTFTIVDKELE